MNNDKTTDNLQNDKATDDLQRETNNIQNYEASDKL